MYRVEIIGNVGQDAETRLINDREVCTFRVAVNEYRQGRESTTWVNVNKDSAKLAQYVKKGAKVFVRGNQRLSTYMKDGQTRQSIDIYASEVEILSQPTLQPSQLEAIANKLEGNVY